MVTQKIDEFENAQTGKFLEMKLMTLGAIEDGMAREMIGSKLDAIETQTDKETSAKQSMIAELKLLVG